MDLKVSLASRSPSTGPRARRELTSTVEIGGHRRPLGGPQTAAGEPRDALRWWGSGGGVPRVDLCSKTKGFWTVGSAQVDQPSGGAGGVNVPRSWRRPCLHLARGDISAVAGRAGFDPMQTSPRRRKQGARPGRQPILSVSAPAGIRHCGNPWRMIECYRPTPHWGTARRRALEKGGSHEAAGYSGRRWINRYQR